MTSEGGHLLPARGKDPNRGLYVFLHPSLSIEACFEAGHWCQAKEQGPRWVKKEDVKVIYRLNLLCYIKIASFLESEFRASPVHQVKDWVSLF